MLGGVSDNGKLRQPFLDAIDAAHFEPRTLSTGDTETANQPALINQTGIDEV